MFVFLPVNFHETNTHSLRLSTQPPMCSCMPNHLCAFLKFQSVASFGYLRRKTKQLHTLVQWQECVALLFGLLCLTQVKQPEFHAKDNRILKTILYCIYIFNQTIPAKNAVSDLPQKDLVGSLSDPGKNCFKLKNRTGKTPDRSGLFQS